ncbi:glycoside hydrolase family 105 protein [Marinoscillum sp. MHG1-6]|uniref:glycoside hydrolase family 88/105 protein n=1 Tax=Marinoscillum sp. MHG1-6 TaxID=2959627 RepID=UPI002157049B|nr:glycoside hydrolase family 88 protein [Marinoscillum sp. MHG1-6]
MITRFKQLTLMITVVATLSFACQSKKPQAQEVKEETRPWSQRMADSEMKRNPSAWQIDFQKRPKWAYVNGLVCDAILRVWTETGDQKYFDYVLTYADSLIDENGEILRYKKEDFNIDKIESGKMLFPLYKQTGDERYRKTIEILFDQLMDQPRIPEGGFWHKQIYTNQMWLDGIYMGTPFYAKYAVNFGDSAMFDDITLQFDLLGSHAKDPETGWYYHGWDATKSVYWADPETGLSKNFWSRGVGWYYMALIDVLDYLPNDHPKKQILIDQFKGLSETIVNYQDSAGLWYQVPNYPDREGNYHESTCAAMFVYGMMKGVDKGVLDKSYIKPAMKGFNGIVNELIIVHPDGEVELTNCCAGAGLGPADNPVRDGSYQYYIEETVRSNDGKGTGPFIMAALIQENSELFKGQIVETK